MRAFTRMIDALTGEEYLEVYVRGQQVLSDTLLNKGTAFTEDERIALQLDGIIRPNWNSLEQQVARVLENFHKKGSPLDRYIYLQSLLDRNETLFYRVLSENLTAMLPLVYTPTVGDACLQMSHITRRFRGVYIDRDNIGKIDKIFESLGRQEVSLIVVTDGERILGLGDLGSDGMPIPIGKINLYVAAGGIHPSCCLPVCLDVGTNNKGLLDDPMYLGEHHPRLTGQAYDDFIERFVLGVRRCFPNALLQWEDFAKHTAFKLLERYQNRLLSFNDDIQGTGAVAISALISGLRIKKTRFSDERFLVVGAGQAGLGICFNVRAAMREEGLSEEEIKKRIFAIDMDGLLVEGMPNIEEPQKGFLQSRNAVAGWKLDNPNRIDLLDVLRNAGITMLAGVTAKKGLFDDKVLAALGRNTERPIVLALSNPTSKSECSLVDVVRATDGRGMVATGSPFPDETWNGRNFRASQCNNLYIFPGMGLGCLVARAAKVTHRMFFAASKAISNLVTEEQRAQGMLLPDMDNIREVSAQVALAVAIEARESGLGRRLSDDELRSVIQRAQWHPRYLPYRPGAVRSSQ